VTAQRQEKPYGARHLALGVANGWLIALGLFSAYIVFIVWLLRTGRMQKWNLSLLLGIILMVRTQRGRKLLDWFAKPKRFWHVFGDLGTVVTLVGMVLMTILMLSLIPTVLNPKSAIRPLAASEILVIPGVNPFVPLWYGIAALIITLVVHEGGHGVLARANNLRVKSMGLLFAVVPVGAFVEPDEDDVKAAPRRHRLRVFAAGAFVNLVVAAVLLSAFGAMAGSMEPKEGVAVQTVVLDSPAHGSGFERGDIITSARTLRGQNAGPTVNFSAWNDFRDYMDTQRPGNEVRFLLRTGDEHVVVLTSFWTNRLDNQARQDILAETESGMAFCNAYFEQEVESGSACAEALQEEAFLGISPFPSNGIQGILAHPYGGGGVTKWVPVPVNLLTHLTLPISEVRGLPVLSSLHLFYETPWDGTAFEDFYFPVAILIFWVFWINLMVGLTNILPMLPLDGGHIFRDAVGGVVARLRPALSEERRDKLVGALALAVSLIILGAFLLQIFGPRFVQA
jgi:membrane-associated protease RseP (regulator of RpoE activity)